MFDDDDSVAALGQTLEHVHQHGDVLGMQAGSRLVEDVECTSGILPGQLGRYLDPLVLSAAEGQGGLSETDVAEAHVLEGLELAGYRRHGGEELHGLGDGHLEDVVDALALVLDRQHVRIEPLAVAFLAGDGHRREEIHLDDLHPRTLAGLAAAALDIERELIGLETADLGVRSLGEEIADVGEHAGVGRGVGARGTAHRRLVYLHELVDVLQALQFPVRQHLVFRAVEPVADDRHEGVVDQGGLAAAADSADADDAAERKADVHVLEIVAGGPAESDQFPVARTAVGRHLYLPRSLEVLEGKSPVSLPVDDRQTRRQPERRVQLQLRRPAEKHLAALLARARTDVHDPVRTAHHLLVVLHDHDRIALVAQPPEGVDEFYIVRLMQPDAGLVEDVQHIDQLGADLGGQTDALALPAAERHSAAAQREIRQPDIHQKAYPLPEFLDDICGHRLPPRVEFVLQTAHPVVEHAHVHIGDLRYVEATYLEAERVLPEPLAVTLRTHHLARIPAGDAVILLAVPLEPREQPREGDHLREPAAGIHPDQVLRAVENDVHCLLGNVLYRVEKGKTVFAGHRLEDREHRIVPLLAERGNAAVRDGQRWVGDYLGHVHLPDGAEAVAHRAGPRRGVEGKCMGRRLGEGYSAVRTDKMLAEMADFPGLRVENHQGALALRQGGEDRGAYPLAVLLLGHHPVDDRLYEMHLVAVHPGGHVPERTDFPVDAGV